VSKATTQGEFERGGYPQFTFEVPAAGFSTFQRFLLTGAAIVAASAMAVHTAETSRFYRAVMPSEVKPLPAFPDQPTTAPVPAPGKPLAPLENPE
jgi:hypothetical protein